MGEYQWLSFFPQINRGEISVVVILSSNKPWEISVVIILSSNKYHVLGFLFRSHISFSDKLGRFQHLKILQDISCGNFGSLNFFELITQKFFDSYIFPSYWLGKIFHTKVSRVNNSDIFSWLNHLRFIIWYYLQGEKPLSC